MAVLACSFLLAGLLLFSVLLCQQARGMARRLADPSWAGPSLIAISMLTLALMAAIDTGFVLLLVTMIRIALHPPTLP